MHFVRYCKVELRRGVAGWRSDGQVRKLINHEENSEGGTIRDISGLFSMLSHGLAAAALSQYQSHMILVLRFALTLALFRDGRGGYIHQNATPALSF